MVTTHYAHLATRQLELSDRVAGWVAPGGTLLIVGHLHAPGAPAQAHRPPAEASATPATITARLDGRDWEIATATEHRRTLPGHGGRAVTIDDVVVRATRRG